MKTKTTIEISARNLGSLDLDEFCPRCMWIQWQLGEANAKPPFGAPLPGVFSSIDMYTKKAVHSYFDGNGRCPQWLADTSLLGEVVGYEATPGSQNFRARGTKKGHMDVVVSGTADDIFRCADDSYTIVDYKTARHTPRQDKLFPLYKAQLNVYAYIAESLGTSPVSSLALIYMEPPESDVAVAPDVATNTGFNMDFTAKPEPVDIDKKMVPRLMDEVREIFDPSSVPDGKDGCEDCENLKSLNHIAGL